MDGAEGPEWYLGHYHLEKKSDFSSNQNTFLCRARVNAILSKKPNRLVRSRQIWAIFQCPWEVISGHTLIPYRPSRAGLRCGSRRWPAPGTQPVGLRLDHRVLWEMAASPCSVPYLAIHPVFNCTVWRDTSVYMRIGEHILHIQTVVTPCFWRLGNSMGFGII